MNKLLIAALFSTILISNAQAHADLEQKTVESNAYYKAVMKIGHGCNGKNTNSVIIEIPEGVESAKPMPKAGWDLEVVKGKLKKPYQSHGQQDNEDTVKIIWSKGNLNHAYYDEFVFQAKISSEPGTLYFPTKQICGNEEVYWNEIPMYGEDPHSYTFPAPSLKIIEGLKHQH